MKRPLSRREHIEREIAARRAMRQWEHEQAILRRHSFDLKCLEMRVGRVS